MAKKKEDIKQEEGTAVEAVKDTTETVVNSEALEKVATVVAEQLPRAFDALKASVSSATFLTPEVIAQLTKFGKVVGVAALDAALVSVNDNIATVNVGSWTPLVVTLTTVFVREARNAIHGGKVMDGTTPPAEPTAPTVEVKPE